MNASVRNVPFAYSIFRQIRTYADVFYFSVAYRRAMETTMSTPMQAPRYRASTSCMPHCNRNALHCSLFALQPALRSYAGCIRTSVRRAPALRCRPHPCSFNSLFFNWLPVYGIFKAAVVGHSLLHHYQHVFTQIQTVRGVRSVELI